MTKVVLTGEGSLGIASHITHAQTLDNKPIIVGEKEEKGINTELPQLIQNIIKDVEKSILTEFEQLTTPLSGREKRRQRRKQERKRK